MPQVDESKDNMMGAQEVSILTVRPDQDGTELVNPCETTLRNEAVLVGFRTEEAFASAFRLVLGEISHLCLNNEPNR